eukprot:TRINITY_DN5908_c0_g1_i2.p1 TRINITY_DN5908_c0_g1~~TRINITY_DN5908_c0_g1_i2.p1  ORF type:complete len:137 (+),score=20.56 TRINITY_DN5908_c0_g1_i2:32-442(+)
MAKDDRERKKKKKKHKEHKEHKSKHKKTHSKKHAKHKRHRHSNESSDDDQTARPMQPEKRSSRVSDSSTAALPPAKMVKPTANGKPTPEEVAALRQAVLGQPKRRVATMMTPQQYQEVGRAAESPPCVRSRDRYVH